MTAPGRPPRFLVLSSRRAFEAFTGPVPAALRERYVFRKADQGARILACLPEARLVISQTYPRPEVNRWIFEARRRGVLVMMSQSTLPAESFYASAGFRRLGLIDVDMAPGVVLPAVEMRLDLA